MRNKSLALENMGLAYKIAWKFYRTGRDMDDLRAVALLGLVKAADAFDFGKEAKFSTYAGVVITNEILGWLKKERKFGNVQSLDAEIGETGIVMLDTVPDTRNPIKQVEDRYFCDSCLGYLEQREREVLLLISEKSISQREIARLYGVTQPYISKIATKAAQKIRRRCNAAGGLMNYPIDVKTFVEVYKKKVGSRETDIKFAEALAEALNNAYYKGLQDGGIRLERIRAMLPELVHELNQMSINDLEMFREDVKKTDRRRIF